MRLAKNTGAVQLSSIHASDCVTEEVRSETGLVLLMGPRKAVAKFVGLLLTLGVAVTYLLVTTTGYPRLVNQMTRYTCSGRTKR